MSTRQLHILVCAAHPHLNCARLHIPIQTNSLSSGKTNPRLRSPYSIVSLSEGGAASCKLVITLFAASSTRGSACVEVSRISSNAVAGVAPAIGGRRTLPGAGKPALGRRSYVLHRFATRLRSAQEHMPAPSRGHTGYSMLAKQGAQASYLPEHYRRYDVLTYFL